MIYYLSLLLTRGRYFILMGCDFHSVLLCNKHVVVVMATLRLTGLVFKRKEKSRRLSKSIDIILIGTLQINGSFVFHL